MGKRSRTAQTDTADEADVDDVAVTEASSTEIDDFLRWGYEVDAGALVGEEGEHEVLEQALGIP